MTLFETYKAIETVANRHPNVNSVVDDFDKLNVETAKYSAIVIQEDIHSRTDEFMTYNFILGYVDRMVSERDDDVAIHSKAISILNNIINALQGSQSVVDISASNYNVFTKRFDALCAGAYCTISIQQAISACDDLEGGSGILTLGELDKTFTANGRYRYRAHGLPWDRADLKVNVQPQVDLQTKVIAVDANGQITVTPDLGKTGLDKVVVNIDVATERKPEESISKTYNHNGEFNIFPQEGYAIRDAHVTVDVHPTETLSKDITENGQYGYTGDYHNANIRVNVPLKPEDSLERDIVGNGTYVFDPTPGRVYNHVELDVQVPLKPEEQLNREISTNGPKRFIPSPGGVFNEVVLDVQVPMKPERTFERTYVSNGTYIIEPSTEGTVYSQGTVIVDIPSDIHNQAKNITFTTNGYQEVVADQGYSGLSKVGVTVNLPDPPLQEKVVNPIAFYDQECIPDDNKYGLSRVTVKGVTAAIDSDIQPENIRNGINILGVVGSMIELQPQQKNYSITSNGTTAIVPDSGYNAINSGNIVVDVHPTEKLTRTYTTNGNYDIEGEFKDASIVVNVQPFLQTKTVQPTISPIDVTPDDGFYGLGRVHVNDYSVDDIYARLLEANIGITEPIKPEETLNQSITLNGLYHFNPTSGYVFDRANIEVNVHPTDSLTKNITGNGTYTYTGEWKDATINVNVQPNLQYKEVIPATRTQVITPDSGFEGLGQVTVTKVTPDIDSNIVASNIKKDVTILGVTGTFEGTGQAAETSYDGSWDIEGLRAIGWSDTAINIFIGNTPHYAWEDSKFVVSDYNKSLYGVVDSHNVSDYREDPGMIFVPYFEDIENKEFIQYNYIMGTPKTNHQSFYYETSQLRSISNELLEAGSSGGTSLFTNCRNLRISPAIRITSDFVGTIYDGCDMLTDIPSIDFTTASVPDLAYLAANCPSLLTIPPMNTSTLTHMSNFIYNCSGVKRVEGIDFSSNTDNIQINIWFMGSGYSYFYLTRFIVNGVLNCNLSFYRKYTSLDYDSIKSILTAASLKSNLVAKSLTFSNDIVTDRSGELAALVASCTAKNWTITGLTIN